MRLIVPVLLALLLQAGCASLRGDRAGTAALVEAPVVRGDGNTTASGGLVGLNYEGVELVDSIRDRVTGIQTKIDGGALAVIVIGAINALQTVIMLHGYIDRRRVAANGNGQGASKRRSATTSAARQVIEWKNK